MPVPICFGSLFGISTLNCYLEIVIGIIQIGLHFVSRFIIGSLVIAGKVHYTVTYDAYLK